MGVGSVLFLLPYPLHQAPSQRFRIEAYFPLLQAHGVRFGSSCFLNEKAWHILYQKGSVLQKVVSVLQGYLKRLWVVLFVAPTYDYIFIHREAAPVGPPIFEWLLAKVLRKKIIYDFDDAIWIPKISESNRLAVSVKCFWKIPLLCKWAHRVSAGNQFLAEYAGKYNRQVTIIPTCVDTMHRFNKLQQQAVGKVVIGWTGSHSTMPYLDAILPVLQQMEQVYGFDFLVICNQPPAFKLRSLKFIPWREATEIEDLLRIHIGIMPLQADAWSEGKCGFKLIQYLSLGIPAVASPVGVNKTMVQDGKNGYLCTSVQEWYTALETLLKDASLRQTFGAAGRKQIEQQFSIQANATTFLSLLDADIMPMQAGLKAPGRVQGLS